MDLREKLRRLNAPLPRAAAVDAPQSRAAAVDAPLPLGAAGDAPLPRAAQQQAAASAWTSADFSQRPACDDAQAKERAQRIGQLRALIDKLVQRDDAREPSPPDATSWRLSQLAAAVRGPERGASDGPALSASDVAANWRLSRLATAVRRHAEPAKRPREADPEMEARLSARAAALPWPLRDTPHGPLHVVERWLEPAHCHGRVAVRGALERLPATLAALALDPALEGLDLSRMLFLDTETTGLSGGTGTVAFLVGLAQFDEGTLKLTQLLVPNLGGELPMLVELAERLGAASCILTYNGKSFDWPLLRTRYVLHRLPLPSLPPHVDLLHATRRIWKPRLGSLRLTDIERQILHFFRDDDIDGAEIPARYFAFLRDGASERLVPVLEHNQNDLIALPAMLGTLGERFERIECGEEALDALAFGRLSLRVQDVPRAQAFARLAVEQSEGSALSGHAWSFSGEVERRFGDAVAAVAHYEQALGLAGEPRQAAALRVVLSKLYEHALRDLPGAYRHARHTEAAEGPLAHGRRLGRLFRKLDRQSARARKCEGPAADERKLERPAARERKHEQPAAGERKRERRARVGR